MAPYILSHAVAAAWPGSFDSIMRYGLLARDTEQWNYPGLGASEPGNSGVEAVYATTLGSREWREWDSLPRVYFDAAGLPVEPDPVLSQYGEDWSAVRVRADVPADRIVATREGTGTETVPF